MKKYQYQIIRYVHDRVTSEFVNVGVVVFQPEMKFVKCSVINKYGRLTKFFNDVNGHFILTTLKQFEKAVNDINKSSEETPFDYENIFEITSSVLPKDDSALVCSDVFLGIDIDLNSALSDLFERLVCKYNQDGYIDELRNDKYAWKNIYKKYFDKYEITKSLRTHSVKTAHDTIEFDKSWKNGIWHCYQTLSFDLKKVDTIKNKVYKWSGILNELENSNEELNIYFLTVSPSKYKSIQKFIEDTLVQRSKSVKVSLIKEDEADQFAQNLKKEISEHYN